MESSDKTAETTVPERSSLTTDQKTKLLKYFDRDPTPSKQDLKNISEEVGLPNQQVVRWFQNMRYKLRRKSKSLEGESSESEVQPATRQERSDSESSSVMSPEHVKMCIEIGEIIEISKNQHNSINPE